MLSKICAPVQVGVKVWSTVIVLTLLVRPVEKVRADSLLLKVVQSADARHPKIVAEEVSQSKSLTVRVSPSPAVKIFS